MRLSRLLSILSLAGLVATGAAANTATPPGDAASTVEAVAATGGRTPDAARLAQARRPPAAAAPVPGGRRGPGGAANPAPPAGHAASAVEAVAATGGRTLEFDGVVEAVRAAAVAAQVPGEIVGLEVAEGDRVGEGALLVRIDARVADRQAAANAARLASARADLAAVSRDVERQRRLYRERFISAAALERAEATLAAARATVDALEAETKAAQVQSGLHDLRAPFAGVVSDVPVSEGDMAMPGVPLLEVYDPTALRVAVSVPQAVAARLHEALALRLELPGVPSGPIGVTAADVQPQPVVDAATHTVRLR